MLERLLTLQDISTSVRVSISTLRRAVRAGELPHRKVGKRGQIRVSETDLDAWLAKRDTTNSSDHDLASGPADTPREGNHSPVTEATDVTPGVIRVRDGDVGDGLSYKIITADVRAGLRSLPRRSVSAIVTSPPYFWQRDYEVDGQIGHEATIEGYVTALADTFDEAKPVLEDDGLLFLNLGDAYYNAKGKPHGRDRKHGARQIARERLRAVDGPGLGLPRKSLIGLPWRVALAMQARGWTLRSSVIWHRPNALGEPTSHDRPWRTHENVFIFSKGPKYYFNRKALGADEDLWTIRARPENPYSHCAPFPAELVERCLACGCKPEGIVLDPFLGSGTTALVALQTGRSTVGIELNDEFARLCERRILDSAGQKRDAA